MSPYYKLPMELHETSSHLFFRVAGPGAEEVSVLYDKESMKGIRWKNGNDDIQMQILGSDGEWFYAVMPEEGVDNAGSGPFYGYVQKHLLKNDPEASAHSYIVKIRFGRFTL